MSIWTYIVSGGRILGGIYLHFSGSIRSTRLYWSRGPVFNEVNYLSLRAICIAGKFSYALCTLRGEVVGSALFALPLRAARWCAASLLWSPSPNTVPRWAVFAVVADLAAAARPGALRGRQLCLIPFSSSEQHCTLAKLLGTWVITRGMWWKRFPSSRPGAGLLARAFWYCIPAGKFLRRSGLYESQANFPAFCGKEKGSGAGPMQIRTHWPWIHFPSPLNDAPCVKSKRNLFSIRSFSKCVFK